MKAGIIAAGLGERLKQRGILTPKPLIRVNEEPLIARVIRAAASVQATSVACIINDLTPELDTYLHRSSWPVPLEVIKKTTPSSMESLFTLAPLLADEPFLLFTVDAVFPLESLRRFVDRASSIAGAQGVLALTRFIDDEKPLWVKVDRRSTGEGYRGRSPYEPLCDSRFLLLRAINLRAGRAGEVPRPRRPQAVSGIFAR